MSASASIAASAYAEGVATVEDALAESARAQWETRRPDLHRQRRRLIELRRGVPNDKADPEAQVVRDLLTVYATVLDEASRRTEYRRGLDLEAETRAELDRLRRRASRVGLRVLDEATGEFKAVRREERPPRFPRPERPAAPRPRAAEAPSGADGDGSQPRKRRRRRRSRGSAAPAG